MVCLYTWACKEPPKSLHTGWSCQSSIVGICELRCFFWLTTICTQSHCLVQLHLVTPEPHGLFGGTLGALVLASNPWRARAGQHNMLKMRQTSTAQGCSRASRLLSAGRPRPERGRWQAAMPPLPACVRRVLPAAVTAASHCTAAKRPVHPAALPLSSVLQQAQTRLPSWGLSVAA